jgi:hypothetical protein
MPPTRRPPETHTPPRRNSKTASLPRQRVRTNTPDNLATIGAKSNARSHLLRQPRSLTAPFATREADVGALEKSRRVAVRRRLPITSRSGEPELGCSVCSGRAACRPRHATRGTRDPGRRHLPRAVHGREHPVAARQPTPLIWRNAWHRAGRGHRPGQAKLLMAGQTLLVGRRRPRQTSPC